jgi:hypothetical protein
MVSTQSSRTAFFKNYIVPICELIITPGFKYEGFYDDELDKLVGFILLL